MNRLRLEGIDLSDQFDSDGPPLKLRKTSHAAGEQCSGGEAADPRGWALSLLELKDGSLAPSIAKAGGHGLPELSD